MCSPSSAEAHPKILSRNICLCLKWEGLQPSVPLTGDKWANAGAAAGARTRQGSEEEEADARPT